MTDYLRNPINMTLEGEQGGWLHCGNPECTEGDYTHLDNVTLVTRREEDGPIVQMDVDLVGTIETRVVEAKDADDRRQWLILKLDCEGCCTRTHIEFIQHKGVTIVQTHLEQMPDEGDDPDDYLSNFLCIDGDDHQWPAELDDGKCEMCGLPYDEWSAE